LLAPEKLNVPYFPAQNRALQIALQRSGIEGGVGKAGRNALCRRLTTALLEAVEQ